MDNFHWTDELIFEFVNFYEEYCKSHKLTWTSVAVEEFKKSKEQKDKEPIFKTEDGVDIYEEMEYWYIMDAYFSGSWEIQKKVAHGTRHNKSYVRFSTMEAAEEYVIINKPILSLNEILNVWSEGDNPEYYKSAPLFKRFLKTAKEKL